MSEVVNKQSKKSFTDGITLVITLIALSTFLYLKPDYLGYKTISMIVSSVILVIGFIGLTVELSRLKMEGYSDFILGVVLLVIWGTVYHFYSPIWLNVIMLFFMIFGIYGTTRGLTTIVNGILTNNQEQGDSKWKKLIILIIQLIGFGATVLQYLTSFKIM